MPNLSNSYNVKYKTRSFAQNGIKNSTKLSLLKKHYNVPNIMIGSLVEDISLAYEASVVETVKDTTFTKSNNSYDNTGWEICGDANYGLATPSIFNAQADYDGSKTYDHRIEAPFGSGNYVTEDFKFPKMIKIDSTHSPFEGSFATAGDFLKFSGVVIGDEDFNYKIIVEYSNGTIDEYPFTGSPGDLVHLNLDSFRSITGSATFTFEVTWNSGKVQTETTNFTVVD